MCLAIPAQIVEVGENDSLQVDIGGVVQTVSGALVEQPKVGDFVIVHVGYALSKLDKEEAERTLQDLRALRLVDE